MSSFKKNCPPHQVLAKVCQNRCINQKTMNEKIMKKIQRSRSLSRRSFPIFRRSSSSKYYTAKQSLSSTKKKKKSPSFLEQIKNKQNLKKVSSPRKKLPSFLEQIKIKQNLKKVSPVKKQHSPAKKQLMKQILEGKNKLKKAKISPRKTYYSPKRGGGSILDLMKTQMKKVRKNIGSRSSSNEEWN
jgi:hypothetical protein